MFYDRKGPAIFGALASYRCQYSEAICKHIEQRLVVAICLIRAKDSENHTFKRTSIFFVFNKCLEHAEFRLTADRRKSYALSITVLYLWALKEMHTLLQEWDYLQEHSLVNLTHPRLRRPDWSVRIAVEHALKWIRQTLDVQGSTQDNWDESRYKGDKQKWDQLVTCTHPRDSP